MAGNITKIKEGSYRLRYKDYSTYIKAKNDREAERLLAKYVTQIDSGDFAKPSKITFREFSRKYLEEYAEIELAPKTVYRYRELLEGRVYPAFGDKRLDKIKPLDILEFYNSLRKDHQYLGLVKGGGRQLKPSGALSEATIKHYHRLISAIFEKAIQWDVLKGKNPAKQVDAPKAEKKKAKCFDEQQILALLEALEGTSPEELKYKVATIIALTTGARLGEIMGLEWHDIKPETKTIEIRRSSQYLPGEGTFTKAPKNETSVRKISVEDTLLDLLEEYKQDQQNKGFICRGNNRLFVTWEGKPMHPYTVTKWFPEFLEKNKLPRLNFHGLRHTHITYLLGKGVPVQTVGGRAGHSSPATTQNIYSHFLENMDRQAAELMENALKKELNKGKFKGAK